MRTRSLLVLLALAACDGPTDVDDADALMRTSARTYVLITRDDRVEVDIPFTFDNQTGGDVYLTGCGGFVPPFLERKHGDEWRTAWTPNDYGCSFGGPVKIPAGQLRADTLRVVAYPFGSRRTPQFSELSVAGTYRLRWNRALSSYDFESAPPGPPIALEHRVSNEFRLEGEYRAVDPNLPELSYLDLAISKNRVAVGDSAKVTATGFDQFRRPISVTEPISWVATSQSIPPFMAPGGLVNVWPWGTVVGVRPGIAGVIGRVGGVSGGISIEVIP